MWFITVLEKLVPDDRFYVLHGDTRTWGYYVTRDEATDALHENRADMWEHCYGYAVIEKFGPGICPECKERQWFKFDPDRYGYFEIEEPDCVKHIVNFAIG